MVGISSFFSIILILCALALTLRLRGFQLVNMTKAIGAVLGLHKKKAEKKANKAPTKNSTTPFQAMASALGGSIGTANIAGTASAIALGGAGAVFYMWLAAVLGMALKFSEIVLAVRYREKLRGEYVGGPMLYIKNGLNKKPARLSPALSKLAKPLAFSYAVFTLLSSALGTPLVQSNTVARSAADMMRSFNVKMPEGAVLALAGVLCAVLTGAVVIGGAKRIGKLSALLVPVMALGYIAVCFCVLIKFKENILPSFKRIFTEALGIRQIGGGVCGICVARAVRIGVSRGVYSNEAGVGSSAMAHANAETDSPVRQGLYGIFEVFADTLVMCSLTALVVLASGAALPADASVSGTSIALSAFSSVLGEKAAGVFLAASLLLFAYTSIIGWSVYGLAAAKYLFGERARLPYCILFTLLTALGALVRVDIAWKCGEMLNYLMAAPNLIALLLLSSEVKKEIGFYK